MKYINSLMFATLVGVMLPSSIARADGISIAVNPWLAPNSYGSPSFAQAAQNAANGERLGQTSYGSSGPTQFNATTTATSAQAIVTNFNSWMGVANPSDPAYAGELGNRITFAVAITDASGFNISGVSYAISSQGTSDFNDPAFDKPAPAYVYGANYNSGGTLTSYWIGVDAKGNLITDPTYSGMVVALYGSGNGASEDTYCYTACTTATEQALIDAAAANPSAPYSVSGTYSLMGTSGTGTMNLTSPSATPEPSTLALLGTGAVGLAGLVRRRFRK